MIKEAPRLIVHKRIEFLGYSFPVPADIDVDHEDKLVKIICSLLNISPALLYSTFREKPYPDARKILWWIKLNIYGKTPEQVATEFDVEHSSVTRGAQKIIDLYMVNDKAVVTNFRIILKLLSDYLYERA